jgi:hypothetical protein
MFYSPLDCDFASTPSGTGGAIMKNARRLALGLVLAAGQAAALAQECAVPATSSGFAFLIQERTDAVNLCPAAAVNPYSLDMAFAWGSATIQFLGGSPWVAASPAQGDLPAQIWFRRFDSSGTALDSVPRAIVGYSGDFAWGHQYPSLAIERPAVANFQFTPTPQVALTFQADFSGFSKIAPSAGSRVIYASRNGNSNNSGYSPESPLPLADGLALLRDGYPDQLLLEREQSAQTYPLSSPIQWARSGRSIDEPMVLGAYGEGSRPILAISHQSVIFSSGSSPVSHLRFLGLELQAPGYNGCGQQNSEATGIVVVRPGSDLWIEDCLFRKFGSAVELQGNSSSSRERNIVRRSTFWEISRSTWDSNRCSNDNGGSCIFQDFYATSIIEDSFFGFSGATPPDSCSRNAEQALSNAMYNGQGNPDTQAVRNSITFNTGRSGFNLRSGGLIERNASIRNAQAFPVGNSSNPNNIATLKHNLCIESRDHQGFRWVPCHSNPPQPCVQHPCNPNETGYWVSPFVEIGRAYILDRLLRANVIQNIACNSTDGLTFGGGDTAAFEFKGGSAPDIVDMSQNIVWDWIDFPSPPSWGGATITSYLQGNMSWSLDQNEIMQRDNHKLLEARDFPLPFTGVGFGTNPWHSARTNTTAPWFWEFRNGNHNGITNTTWTSTVESTASYGLINYSDPGRTVGSYASSIGLSNSTDAFIQALAAREHNQWDHELSAYGLIDYIRDGFDLPALDRLPGPNCTGHFANMFSSFTFDVSSFPRVNDDAPSICNKGRASISMAENSMLRVGGGIDRQGIWYAWGTNSPSVLDSSTNLATTPCVSAATSEWHVAVWLVQNGSTWDLKGARLHPQLTPAVFTLKTGLTPPPQVGNSPVQYGAWEPVIPPSVSCFDDGSFAVSYSDGEHRWVSLYSGSTPALQKNIHVDAGFAQFNHCVAVSGLHFSHSQARVAFVGISQPDSGEPWAPYVRTHMPYYGGCRMSRPHHIPKVSPHESNLALGPAFAHPIAYRPDGSLVITWWRQFPDQGQTKTTLGASVFETAGTYCPADLNCDGSVDSADTSIFNGWMLAGNMLADFNCDGQLTPADANEFATRHAMGCQ